MGILKKLLGLRDKDKIEYRAEKTERIRIDGTEDYMVVHDGQAHWQEDIRWNPESDRWDKLDFHGNVTGHIERNISGDLVHTDRWGKITQVDKREEPRTVAHYDGKGNKTGYTTKDYSNNLTKHTYIENKKRDSGSGFIGFLEPLHNDAVEFNRRADEIHRKYSSGDSSVNDDDA